MECKRALNKLLTQSLSKKQIRSQLLIASKKLQQTLLSKSLHSLGNFTKFQKEKKAVTSIAKRFRKIKALKSCFRKLAAYSAQHFAQR